MTFGNIVEILLGQGKPVKVRCGPAAVTGDESRLIPLLDCEDLVGRCGK